MRQRGAGLDQVEPVLGKRQVAQKRRAERHGMDCRADVVHESGTRELRGAHATAERVPSLDELHRVSSAGKDDGRREAVWPRADDGRVVAAQSLDPEAVRMNANHAKAAAVLGWMRPPSMGCIVTARPSLRGSPTPSHRERRANAGETQLSEIVRA